jgi:hypothetical protein
MPTKRVKTGVRNLSVLTHAQRSYLLSGHYLIVGDAQFEDDDEADAAWELHRERLLSEWDIPGRRPPMMWDQDFRLGCINWPNEWAWPKPFENEMDAVRGMILAGKLAPCRWDGNNRVMDEVAEIEAIWLQELRVALSGGHSTAAAVPRWFRAEHTPAVKTEIAAERSALRRSLAQNRTSAEAGEAASRS